MDEADCCRVPEGLRPATVLGGLSAVTHPAEEICGNPTALEGQRSSSPFPTVREPRDCGLGNSASLEVAVCGKRRRNGCEGRSPAPEVDGKCNGIASEAFQTLGPVWATDHLGNRRRRVSSEPTSVDRVLDRCLADGVNDHHHDSSGGAVDETDQGQVPPPVNLPGVDAEYSGPHLTSQYYAKPAVGRPTSPGSDATVTESSGFRTDRRRFGIGETFGSDDSPSPCAIRQFGASAQCQPLPNRKPHPESSPEDVAKRKVCPADENMGEDDSSVMKKQKVSPSVRSDVQYNQNVLSMPKEYQVSGTGNYIFDSPNSCTFHLYQNHSVGQSQKQHAFEWAGVASQTDSGSDAGVSGEVPARALETVAKLVANTTNWKTFARRLPMSEGVRLEADIKALDDCQGTTSDKTAAVLMRWWKGHPWQRDAAAMRERLREGLESCSLRRLARTLDKYL